jgi:hypothetical protein
MAPVVGVAIALLAAGTLIAASVVGDTVDPYARPDALIEPELPAVAEAPPMVAPGGNINGELVLSGDGGPVLPRVEGVLITRSDDTNEEPAPLPPDDVVVAAAPAVPVVGEPKIGGSATGGKEEPGGGNEPGGGGPVARPTPPEDEVEVKIPPGHAKHDGPDAPPGHANHDGCDGPPGHAVHDAECAVAGLSVEGPAESEDDGSNGRQKEYAKKDDNDDREPEDEDDDNGNGKK